MSSKIVSSWLGVRKDRADEWFTYCMAARGHITRFCAPRTFTVKRRTSCNPGPKSVMQRGRRMRRRISYYPRNLGRFVGGTDRIFSYVRKYENDPAYANNTIMSQRRDRKIPLYSSLYSAVYSRRFNVSVCLYDVLRLMLIALSVP